MAVVYDFNKARNRRQPVLRTAPAKPAVVLSIEEFQNRIDDEYEARAYEGFVNFMRFAVSIQDPTDHIVSVFPDEDGGFVVLVDGTVSDNIDEAINIDASFENDEEDLEDILIKQLVELAPYEIDLHWREGMSDMLVETIQAIFGERVRLVTG